MHFSVLQRVAMGQFEATHCNMLKFAFEVAPFCNIPVVVCCSVLQRVAVCCSALQCVAMRCSALLWVLACCSVSICCSLSIWSHILQHAAICFRRRSLFNYDCCNVSQCVVVCCSVLHCNACQCVPVCFSVFQFAHLFCNELKYFAVFCRL